MAATAVLLLTIAQGVPGAMLDRVAEEAEIFAQSIAKVIGEETMRQKALEKRRPRIRIGAAALNPVPLRYQERELHSEFGYALMGDGGGVFHEARQILAVDGKQIADREKARRKLVMGLRSKDDEVKKRLLEDLEKHGLIGSATDFTLMLLLFRARHLGEYNWRLADTKYVGADKVQVFQFVKKEGDGAFTIFQNNQAVKQTLRGELWLRSDGLPVKVTFGSAMPQGDGTFLTDYGEVEYARGASPILLPVAALHRRANGGTMLAENIFRYGAFKRFTADSEIKFTPVDEEPPAGKP